MCALLSLTLIKTQERIGEKKKCGRNVYRVDVCQQDTVRVSWVNDEPAMRGWPTSYVPPCELKPLGRVKWTRDNSFLAHFSPLSYCPPSLPRLMHHLKPPGLAGALTTGVTDGVKPARPPACLPDRTQSQQTQGRLVCVCVLSPFLHNQHFPRQLFGVYQRRQKGTKEWLLP